MLFITYPEAGANFASEDLNVMPPIDPFSPKYWESTTSNVTGSMDPPRFPLSAVKGTSAGVNGSNKSFKLFGVSDPAKPSMVPLGIATKEKAAKKSMAADDLAEFKKAVDGSDLSKLGLVEVLHKDKRFSNYSKNVVKDTLVRVAKRVGAKEADKRWVLVEELSN